VSRVRPDKYFTCKDLTNVQWSVVCDGREDCSASAEDEFLPCEHYRNTYSKQLVGTCTCDENARFCKDRTITCPPGYELVDIFYCKKTSSDREPERSFDCKCFNSGEIHPNKCQYDAMTSCLQASAESTCVQTFNNGGQTCFSQERDYVIEQRVTTSNNLPNCGQGTTLLILR
jgi:hypothetical protein